MTCIVILKKKCVNSNLQLRNFCCSSSRFVLTMTVTTAVERIVLTKLVLFRKCSKMSQAIHSNMCNRLTLDNSGRKGTDAKVEKLIK